MCTMEGAKQSTTTNDRNINENNARALRLGVKNSGEKTMPIVCGKRGVWILRLLLWQVCMTGYDERPYYIIIIIITFSTYVWYEPIPCVHYRN